MISITFLMVATSPSFLQVDSSAFDDAVKKIQVEIEGSPRLDGCRVTGIRHVTTPTDPVGRYFIEGQIAEESQRELIDSVTVGVLTSTVSPMSQLTPIVDISDLVISPMSPQIAAQLYAEGCRHFRCGYLAGSTDQFLKARESFASARRHQPNSSRIAYWRLLTAVFLNFHDEARSQAETLQQRTLHFQRHDIRAMESVQGPQRIVFHQLLQEYLLLDY